jgi:hypothetical protein
MRIRHPSALALPLVPLALFAGCGGGGGSTDIEPTLRLIDRTDAELSRMMNAAVGAEMFQAMSQVDQFGDTFDADPCPTIAISGNTATITGGCTTADGVAIAGMAIVTNPFGWDQFEDVGYGDDTSYEMIGLSFTQGGFTQTYSGLIERAGDFTSWDADVTSDSFGVALRSDIYVSCSGGASSATCRITNSGLELIGFGGVTVSGTQRTDGTALTTDVTLRGEDSLTIHVENNCIAWEISAGDRAYPGPACPPSGSGSS